MFGSGNRQGKGKDIITIYPDRSRGLGEVYEEGGSQSHQETHLQTSDLTIQVSLGVKTFYIHDQWDNLILLLNTQKMSIHKCNNDICIYTWICGWFESLWQYRRQTAGGTRSSEEWKVREIGNDDCHYYLYLYSALYSTYMVTSHQAAQGGK